MKDITDYFSSPVKPAKVDSKSPIIQENKNSPQCKQKINTNQDQSKKKRKKKKKRKHSDPVITDVTQLLSDNLKFSPNNSMQSKLISTKDNHAPNENLDLIVNTKQNHSSIATGSIIKESKLKVSTSCSQINKETEVNSLKLDCEENKNCKLNAFQFMMDQRNKSIGLNSPGKDLSELPESANFEDNKEKLAARRHLFSNWSELKGGAKRKRIEQEKDEIIQHKLIERSKRFKTLLKVESNNNNNKKVINSKRKRAKKISSSSEENEEFEEKEVINISERKSGRTKTLKNLKPMNHKTLENSSEALTEEKISKKNKKCNGVIKTNAFKVELSEETEGNYFHNGIKNVEDESIVNLDKGSNQTKYKMGNLLSYINSDKEKDVLTTGESPIIVINDSHEITKESKKSISKNTKQSKKELKPSKSHRNEKESLVIMDETSQESIVSPHSLKSWRLKIKIKTDKGKNQEELAVSTPLTVSPIEHLPSDQSDAVELSSGSEYDETNDILPKKTLKIAPVFAKLTPKPKIDPAVAEARKQFLMSGIPSSLKKVIQKQNSIIDKPEEFPITSHVQQKCNSSFWDLPQSKLKLLDKLSTSLQTDLKCEKLTKICAIKDINIDMEVKKVVNLKMMLNKIKQENPDYPVNKSFRHIYSKKSVLIEENKIPEKRKRGRKRKDNIVVEKPDGDSTEYCMWTEKYKPKSSQEIIGNSQAIKRLKKWLEDWNQFSQEIHSKRVRKNDTSESDFDTTDGDSRDSSKLPGKIIILEGPCGTGKTTAVYAICNDLDFNVIELNASNKRTGKRLLQELQEATQSHQVRNRDSQSLQTFFQSSKTDETLDQKLKNKMCVLLVEDVDLVFEQDDGFINALLQLTATSKRPVIATTTDYSSLFVQKFFGAYECIRFLPLSASSLAVWLQIVFLVEGSYVSRDEIGSLLEFNKGDVRKTLLQLQFWLQSGGQIQQKPALLEITHKRNSCDEHLGEDELNVVVAENEKTLECDSFEHKNLISTFEILEINEPFRIPYYLNMDLLWWNLPNILNTPNYSKRRIKNITEKTSETPKSTIKNDKSLLLISKIYDSLSNVDVIFKNNGDIGKSAAVKDSLELNENFHPYRDSEFVHELTHYLINGRINSYGNKESNLDVALPDRLERRWKTRLDECETEFREALLLTTDKKSTYLDYLPTLREITRSECTRAANNTKRGNRFRNYLKDLGVKCQDKIITNACKIFGCDSSG